MNCDPNILIGPAESPNGIRANWRHNTSPRLMWSATNADGQIHYVWLTGSVNVDGTTNATLIDGFNVDFNGNPVNTNFAAMWRHLESFERDASGNHVTTDNLKITYPDNSQLVAHQYGLFLKPGEGPYGQLSVQNNIDTSVWAYRAKPTTNLLTLTATDNNMDCQFSRFGRLYWSYPFDQNLIAATDSTSTFRRLMVWGASCGTVGCIYLAPDSDIASVQIGVNTYWLNGKTLGLQGNFGLSPSDYLVQEVGTPGTQDAVSIVTWSSALSGDNPTTSASLATSGVTNTLVAGKTYQVDLDVFCADSTAGDGVKIDFGGGTVSATTFRAQTELINDTGGNVTMAAATATSLTGAMNATAMSTANQHWLKAHAYIKVNAGGTLVPRFSQNTHSTGTLTFFQGSALRSIQTP